MRPRDIPRLTRNLTAQERKPADSILATPCQIFGLLQKTAGAIRLMDAQMEGDPVNPAPKTVVFFTVLLQDVFRLFHRGKGFSVPGQIKEDQGQVLPITMRL